MVDVATAVTELTKTDNLCYCDRVKERQERPGMNVSLTPELERFVSSKVEAGCYGSASELVREALRLLEEHDLNRAAQLAEFNRDPGRRLESLDSGKHVKPADARDRLKRKSVQLRKSRA
jgi:antitoxin ParD1/3/4